MIRRPPRSTHCISSAASDVYKRQDLKIYEGDIDFFRSNGKPKFLVEKYIETRPSKKKVDNTHVLKQPAVSKKVHYRRATEKDLNDNSSTARKERLQLDKNLKNRERSLSADKVQKPKHIDYKILDLDNDMIGSSRTREKSQKMLKSRAKSRQGRNSEVEQELSTPKESSKFKYYEDVVNKYFPTKNLISTVKELDKIYQTPKSSMQFKTEKGSNFSSKKTSHPTIKEKVLEDFVLFGTKQRKEATSRNGKPLKTFFCRTQKPKDSDKSQPNATPRIKPEKSSRTLNKTLKYSLLETKEPLLDTSKESAKAARSKKNLSMPFVTCLPKTIVSKPMFRLCGSNVTFTYYSGNSSQGVHI
eukprot:TRINITY_DN2585_c0_g1_i5.p1 TRINITY_DN2585_c0_g1~~TRINITY_DN2585_c0_g1_i5.p1  ORF type:complete len:366 (-),score=72.44 TRINITY_DN2585_c0_g1_i5:56-1129(-)